MEKEILEIKDTIAMAEAYRVYELMEDHEKEKIPQDFVNRLLYYGDFKKVGPFSSMKEVEEGNISKEGMYLVMYMCTYK
jgi:hypothetical protein